MSATKPERTDYKEMAMHDWQQWTGDRAMHWYGWGSPVGLGLFVVLIAVAVEIIRHGFH